jgi:hypothetical protein
MVVAETAAVDQVVHSGTAQAAQLMVQVVAQMAAGVAPAATIMLADIQAKNTAARP